MAIEVTSEFRRAILDNPDLIEVSVRADPDLAGEALRRAKPDLVALRGILRSGLGEDAGWTEGLGEVFPVDYLPDGAMMLVEGKSAPDEVLALIPDVVSRHLLDVGVKDATIGVPVRMGGPLVRSLWPGDVVLRQVAAYFYPSPGGREMIKVPMAVADAVAQWVCGDLPQDYPLWSVAGQTEFSVLVRDVPDMVEAANRRDVNFFLLAGRPPSRPPGDSYPPVGWNYEQVAPDALERLGERLRWAHVSFGNHPRGVTVGGRGPESSDNGLIALYGSLVAMIRRLAGDAAYACVGFNSGALMAGPGVRRPGPQMYDLEVLSGEFAFDAYPYQILGPGHLARLGGPPPGAEPLDEGRIGLALGEPADWLRPSQAPALREWGRQLLAPCLPSVDERVPLPPAVAAMAKVEPITEGWVPLGEGRLRRPTARQDHRPLRTDTPVAPSLSELRWVTLAALPTPRRGLAVATTHGRLYAIGGSNSEGLPLKTVEAYDEASGRWGRAAPLPEPRTAVIAATAPDGRIYVASFSDGRGRTMGDVYDPVADEWDTAAPVPVMQSDSCMATGADGFIYLFGTIMTSLEPLTYLGIVQRFDPQAGSWIRLGSFPAPRHNFVLASGPDGLLYVIGGQGPDDLPATRAYDPHEDQWREVASLSSGRHSHAAVTGPDGRIYVTGGMSPTWRPTATAERYDPATGQTSMIPSLPTERYSHAAAAGSASVYVVGGASADGLTGEVAALRVVEPS